MSIYFQKVISQFFLIVDGQWLWEYISQETREIGIWKFSVLSLCFLSSLCYSERVGLFLLMFAILIFLFSVHVPWLHSRILIVVSGGKIKMYVQNYWVLRESCNKDWACSVYHKPEVFKLNCVSESPGALDKTDCWTSPSLSDAKKFPGLVQTTCLGTTVWEPLLSVILFMWLVDFMTTLFPWLFLQSFSALKVQGECDEE